MSDTERPVSARDLAQMKEHLELLIEMNDRRYNESSVADRRNLLSALEVNNQRLDALSEFRSTLSDTAGRMVTRAEYESGRQNNRDKLDQLQSAIEARYSAEIRPLEAKVDAVGRTNWPLLASLMMIFLGIVGGVWVLIGLKIEATLAPLSLTLEQVRTTQQVNSGRISKVELAASGSQNADVQSKTDRDQLNSRVVEIEHAMASGVAERRAAQATIAAKLIEVETQFCASDVMRNLTHAQDMRTTAVLWRQAFPNNPLPTDNAYYPRICNRDASSG